MFKAMREAATEAAAIRRLKAELGVESSPWRGVLFGVLIGVVFGGLLLVLMLGRSGDAAPVYGRVIGYGGTQSKFGSLGLVRVYAGDREVSIRHPVGPPCDLGDRIKLNRLKAFLCYRYSAGFNACEHGP